MGSNVNFPAGEPGQGRNVLASPAESLPHTLARDGGLGPFSVQSFSPRLSPPVGL